MLLAIRKELLMRKQELHNTTVETIYFGGGTPSILTPSEIQSLIDEVYRHYQVVTTPEITLEANPDDLSQSAIKALSSTSINRLSIGIQSFFDKDLKLMNRAHNANEARTSLEGALKYFDNISVDLIYGIQEQTDAQWHQNLEITTAYNIPHISSYTLTVEPKTAMSTFIKKGVMPDVDDDQAQRQFLILVDYLNAKDFVHYEISNFGKTGFFSQNNSAYWQGKSYLGIGPSAHSFNGKQRLWNVSNNSQYIKSLQNDIQPATVEHLSTKDQYNEYVMTGLRTIWGVSLDELNARFGERFVTYFKQMVSKYLEDALVYEDNQIYRTSKRGKFLADGIAAELFMI